MNTKHLTPINMLLRITALWALLTIALCAASPLCNIIEGWTLLNERLHQEGLTLGQSLKNKLDGDPTISARPRFQNHPGGLTPKMAAQQQIDESLGVAEFLSPGQMGNSTTEAWVNAMTLDRVLSADGISFETMGEGLGQLADKVAIRSTITNKDEKIAQLINAVKAPLGNPDSPYLNAGYTEAHLLRDAKIALEGTQNIPVGDFVLNLGSGSKGFPYEFRCAASRRQANETLVALDADHPTNPLSANYGKGADIVTNLAVYSVKIDMSNVAGAILEGDGTFAQKGKDIAAAIKKAEDLSLPYKFMVPSGNKADATVAFNLLNGELEVIGAVARMDVNTNIIITPLQ